MISPFCATYLKSQGVQILDAPMRKESYPIQDRKPISPVIMQLYERGYVVQGEYGKSVYWWLKT